MKQLQVKIQSHSVAGIKDENQDACACYVPQDYLLERKGVVSVIADGVSSCERAKKASNDCVQGFLTDYYATPDSWGTEHCATKVITALNSSLYSQSMVIDEVSSMLSTMSALIIKSNTAYLFHIGDSRIYRYRDGVLKQLTKDHVTNVNQKETYLSRAIGFDSNVQIDFQALDLKLGDQFLMTTDGVHGYLDHTEMATSIAQKTAVEDLVEMAITKGSQDNASAIICTVNQLPEKHLNEAFDELTQRPIPPDLENGMKINGFEIESLIHASNRTQIYRARDINTNQLVALKTPSINFEDDAQYLKHFVYEEWVGLRIHCPNVVQIHNGGGQSKFLAYAMEYVEGQTLRQWMNNNPQPSIDAVVKIVKQIVQGLRGFHRQEMLHCDLKPENIMIDQFGQIKLIDFGSARIAGIAELATPISVVGNQGTQGYTAPEVILEHRVSRLSDQFSLGVIVYEMFSSKLPYQEKLDKSLTIKKLLKLSYGSVLQHNPHVPIWIDGAIHKACNLEESSRYEVLSEFLFDLEQPNSQFLLVTRAKQPINSILKKYRLFIALSFALNVFMLLLLVS
ncbi:MAG: bifunctional protein-serine/threonine kinase/phosphatase [Candidatus Thioglobus sp.]|nr:bifunctional protein-serine/threonine kinase/phosphatase [Candidatus Thioglobus sp.]